MEAVYSFSRQDTGMTGNVLTAERLLLDQGLRQE